MRRVKLHGCSFICLLLLLGFANPAQAASQVYFITGFPVNVQPAEVQRASAYLKTLLSTSKKSIVFQTIHNSEWENICKEIISSSPTRQINDKLIFIGHSYGAQAETDIARCLTESKIQIDLSISIDMVQKPFFPALKLFPKIYWPMIIFMRSRMRLSREFKTPKGPMEVLEE